MLLEAVYKTRDSKAGKSKKILEFKPEDCKIYEIFLDDFFFDHSSKLDVLDKAITILSTNRLFKNEGKFVNFKKCYEHDISNYRNSLSHKEVGDEIMVRGSPVKVDQKLFHQLRNSINEYDELLSELEVFISKR